MSAPPLDRFPLTPELIRLAEAIRREGGRPLLVGGWVRDCLLGIPHSKDFDVEVFGMDPGVLKGVLGKFGPVHTVGRHFGVLKLATAHGEYDVSVPRRESKTGKGHKGFWVTPDPAMSFEQAAARRDFTINAMGYSLLEQDFLDPYRGWDDLEARTLRHVGPAFGEDPLRVLRAMQFAGRFEFTIVPETIAICRLQDLSELPRERVWEEFRKLLLKAARPAQGLRYARELGVLTIFPELGALEAAPAGSAGVRPWERTLAVVDQAARLRSGLAAGDSALADLVLLLAALSHELGRTAAALAEASGPAEAQAEANGPAQAQAEANTSATVHADAAYDLALAAAAVAPTASWLARLTNELDIPRHVLPLVRLLPRVEELHAQREALPPGALGRLALEVPLAELARLSTARERALGGGDAAPLAAWLAEQARAAGVWEKPLEPLLKGRHLLELGLRSGPQLGPLLDQAYELQLEGRLTTLDAARAWARDRIAAAPPSEAPAAAQSATAEPAAPPRSRPR